MAIEIEVTRRRFTVEEYDAIEVADTTLRYDRRVKVPLYAAEGIREAWIVDVETFAPEAFPDLVLSVSDILG
jgi:hypothetical protein